MSDDRERWGYSSGLCGRTHGKRTVGYYIHVSLSTCMHMRSEISTITTKLNVWSVARERSGLCAQSSQAPNAQCHGPNMQRGVVKYHITMYGIFQETQCFQLPIMPSTVVTNIFLGQDQSTRNFLERCVRFCSSDTRYWMHILQSDQKVRPEAVMAFALMVPQAKTDL